MHYYRVGYGTHFQLEDALAALRAYIDDDDYKIVINDDDDVILKAIMLLMMII
jgi:hypothetical protein